MIALAGAEEGGSVVRDLLADPENRCFAHTVDLCEVYLANAGIQFRSDMDPVFRQRAGRLKARLRRISLADCFGLTLSSMLDAEFVTAVTQNRPMVVT